MADWSLSGDGQVHTAVGLSASAMSGQTVTTDTIVHTKGTWASLGTTGADSGYLQVHLHGVSSWTAPGSPPETVRVLVDIGMDSGTTTTIIPNLLLYHPEPLVGQTFTSVARFPLNVPAGTTLYARAQAAAGMPVSLGVSASVTDCGWTASSGSQQVEAWGIDSGNSDGTTLTPGTAPAWGAYAELTAASTLRSEWLVLAVGCPGSFPAAGATHNYLVEIALGTLGSEQPLITFPVTVNEAGFTGQLYLPPIAASIPVGTRVSARATTDTTGPNLTIAAYVTG